LKEDGAMSRLPTGRRRRIFRLVGQIAAVLAGAVVAVLGAGACILSGSTLFFLRNHPNSLLLLPIFGFLTAVMLLLFLMGVKIVRDAVRAARDHSLDNVDLDREPWMANAEWRNRRIVHKITAVPAVRFLQILGVGVLLCFVVFGVMTVPVRILAMAVLIAGGIALALVFLYRHLRERNVKIRPRDALPVILLLPAIVILPGTLGLFSPEINRVLEAAAMTFMVCAAAGIFAYLFLKEKKYGTSICHLRTLPAFVGGAFEAEIEIDFPQIETGLPELPEGPVEAELQNIEGHSRSVTIHWRKKIAIPAEQVIRPGDGTLRITVAFEIPIEERDKMKKRTIWTGAAWKLGVRAAFPGVDYASWFVVPVYFPEDFPWLAREGPS
jgi:EamA domain-containing membrane protein RarD